MMRPSPWDCIVIDLILYRFGTWSRHFLAISEALIPETETISL